MKVVSLLGNGPSLKNISLEDICSTSNIVIGCNRIYLHNDYEKIKNNMFVAFSDTSFRQMREEIISYVPLDRMIFASDLKLNDNASNINVKRDSQHHGSTEIAVKNLINFPNVYELSSVFSTIVLPYTFHLSPASVNIYGVDMSYFVGSKFRPYFYEYSKNKSYSWSPEQAKEWSKLFSNEINAQLDYLRKEGMEVK
tara:strand:- start:619 stop:1209 length:591 start_codon:yes stop_codon:yes gene_type:complete